MAKKCKVNENCIGCGLCVGTCDAVFAFGANGTAENVLGDIPEDLVPAVEEAAANCPVQAIEVE